MLEIPRSSKAIESGVLSRVKVLGVGNAGVNLVDRLTIERSFDLETVAINTDLQSLVSSVADSKIAIGEKATRGLGTGGDPEIGADAAYESQTALQAVLKNTALAIVYAGLGGGTGSSVLPVLLEAARTQGTLTATILTLPFHFEGRRRMQQAKDALAKIRSYADAILIFENDRMSENAQPKLGIGETFEKSDLFLTQAAIAIARLVSGIGPLQLTFGDLSTVLRPNLGMSLFGFGQADGEDRTATALKRALENPLFNRGDLLNTAERLLIHIEGPRDLLLSEVQAIVQEVSATCSPSTHILLGINANGSSQESGASASLTVSLLGTCFPANEASKTVIETDHFKSLGPCAVPVAAQSPPVPHPISVELLPQPVESLSEPLPIASLPVESLPVESLPVESLPVESLPVESLPVESLPVESLLVEPLPIEPLPPAREFSFPESPIPTIEESRMHEPSASADNFVESKNEPIETALKPPPKPKQEVLQFEPIARGRFEKSEPTIVDGEDIDVPTFLRMKIKIK